MARRPPPATLGLAPALVARHPLGADRGSPTTTPNSFTRQDVAEDQATIFALQGAIDPGAARAWIVKEFPTALATVIWDLTAARAGHLSADTLRSLGGVAAAHASHQRTAYVADNDLEYGILRMYTAITPVARRGLELRVFRQREQALEWARSFGQPSASTEPAR